MAKKEKHVFLFDVPWISNYPEIKFRFSHWILISICTAMEKEIQNSSIFFKVIFFLVLWMWTIHHLKSSFSRICGLWKFWPLIFVKALVPGAYAWLFLKGEANYSTEKSTNSMKIWGKVVKIFRFCKGEQDCEIK